MLRCAELTAYTRIFASTTPGSTDIIIDVAAMQRTHVSEITSGQIQYLFGGRWRRRNTHLLADQITEKIFDRDAAGLCLKPLL